MRKLTLSLILMILCAMLGLGWAIDQYFEKYSESAGEDMISHYKIIGHQLAQSLDAADQVEGFIERWNRSNANEISLTNKQNFPLPIELENDFLKGDSLVLESDKKLSLHYFLPNKRSVLTFTPDELTHLKPSSVNFVLTSLFYIGILIFILLWIYPLISRLNLLRNTSIKFGLGDLSQRINLAKTSYISDIEKEFNHMARKIETLVFDNKIIGSAVSHDLRTPLARIRLGLDILSETHDPVKRQKYQMHLSDDVDEMQSLIEVLLDYAKLEQYLVKIEKQKIDLYTFLFDCQSYYNDHDMSLELLAENEELAISGDPKYLDMLFKNLLNNAFKYSQKNVTVQIVTDKSGYSVNIHDDGSGVPEEKRIEIFKPFIKFESSGYGMGLAIAERIANWHHAELTVGPSDLLSGAMFQIKFPIS